MKQYISIKLNDLTKSFELTRNIFEHLHKGQPLSSNGNDDFLEIKENVYLLRKGGTELNSLIDFI